MSVIKWFFCSTQIRSSDYAGKTYNSNDHFFFQMKFGKIKDKRKTGQRLS